MSVRSAGFAVVAFTDIVSAVQLHAQMAVVVAMTIIFNTARHYVRDLPDGHRKPFMPDTVNVHLPVSMTALFSVMGKTVRLLKDATDGDTRSEAGFFVVESTILLPQYGPTLLALLGCVTLVAGIFLALWLTKEAAQHPVRMVWFAEYEAVRYVTGDDRKHERYPRENARYLCAFLLLAALSYAIAWSVSYL